MISDYFLRHLFVIYILFTSYLYLGTFLLRLSHSSRNGLVLSYTEPTFNRSRNIRHILLTRQGADQYMTKTNQNSNKCSSLNKLIRSFVKLQFVYTHQSPKVLYKKNHVF